MANKAVWICLGLVLFSTLLFVIGIFGTMMAWFGLGMASALTSWSLYGILLFTLALCCTLPFHEGS